MLRFVPQVNYLTTIFNIFFYLLSFDFSITKKIVLLRLSDGDVGNHAKVTSQGFCQILPPSKVALCHHINVWWRADHGRIIQRRIKCGERRQPRTILLTVFADTSGRRVL